MGHRFITVFWLACLVFVGIGPNFVLAVTPNDPYAGQWGYTVTGVPEAWEYTTGSHEVVVAVIDNGIFADHPDLASNMWRNKKEIAGNGLDDDQNGYVDDFVGWDFVGEDNNPNPDAQVVKGDRSDIAVSHATAVAGIIGAVGNNARDGAGIAWQVQLMNLRVADNTGEGYNSRLASAITYAVKNGADIINLSINTQTASEDVGAALRTAVDAGIAVFAAGGNLGASYASIPSFPVCSDRGQAKQWVIGLSAVGQDRRLTQFSNFGSDCIDLTAPGEEIGSASWYGVHGYAQGWSGTSFATPFASGAAALIKALRPEWKADDLYRALMTRVSHTCLAPDAEYREWYGNGLLRVDRAVRAAAVGPWKSAQTAAHPYVLNTSLWGGTSGGQFERWFLPTTTARTTAVSFGAAHIEQLSGANSVATYQQFPCGRYVAVATPETKKTQRVTVYDAQWQTIGSWTVTSTVPVLVAFSQLVGEEPRVAVAKAQPSTTVVELYSVSGTSTGSWNLKNGHRGVHRLVSVPNQGGWALAALVARPGGYELVTAVGAKTVASVGLPKADYRITAGDFNGRGVGSIVIAAGGVSTTAKWYDLNAEWELSMSFVAPHQNWNWTAGDYNDDGRTDLVLYPVAGAQAARVYDFGGRLIDEPNLFGGNPTGQRWLLWF